MPFTFHESAVCFPFFLSSYSSLSLSTSFHIIYRRSGVGTLKKTSAARINTLTEHVLQTKLLENCWSFLAGDSLCIVCFACFNCENICVYRLRATVFSVSNVETKHRFHSRCAICKSAPFIRLSKYDPHEVWIAKKQKLIWNRFKSILLVRANFKLRHMYRIGHIWIIS